MIQSQVHDCGRSKGCALFVSFFVSFFCFGNAIETTKIIALTRLRHKVKFMIVVAARAAPP